MLTRQEFELAGEQSAQQLLEQLTVLFDERKQDDAPITVYQLLVCVAEEALNAVTALALQLPPEERARVFPKAYPSLDRSLMGDYWAMKGLNV